MIKLEEFEVAAKDLAKAFVMLDSITITLDEEQDAEAEQARSIGNHAASIIKQYWIETASKQPTEDTK